MGLVLKTIRNFIASKIFQLHSKQCSQLSTSIASWCYPEVILRQRRPIRKRWVYLSRHSGRRSSPRSIEERLRRFNKLAQILLFISFIITYSYFINRKNFIIMPSAHFAEWLPFRQAWQKSQRPNAHWSTGSYSQCSNKSCSRNPPSSRTLLTPDIWFLPAHSKIFVSGCHARPASTSCIWRRHVSCHKTRLKCCRWRSIWGSCVKYTIPITNDGSLGHLLAPFEL